MKRRTDPRIVSALGLVFAGSFACASSDPGPPPGAGGQATAGVGGVAIAGAGTASGGDIGATAGGGGTSAPAGAPGAGGSTSGGGTGATAGAAGAGGTLANLGGGGAGGQAGGSGGGARSGGGSGSGSVGNGADMVKSAGCGKPPTITTGNGKQLTVGATTRKYNIRLPSDYANDKPYRLIIGYHGASLSANTVTNESYYGLVSLSEESAIFVAPQGLPTGGSFGDGWSNRDGADVEFSRELITQLENGLCIDRRRIFVEGFSMGGSMAYAMACGAPDIIRAAAVHSGGPMSGCVQHNTPVPYFMTHGTTDGLCTYPQYGVPQLQDFAKVNGCTMPDPNLNAAGFEAALPNPTSPSSACLDFTGCKSGYPVRSCLFVGDHLWNPGGRDSWVPAEVWRFFKQF